MSSCMLKPCFTAVIEKIYILPPPKLFSLLAKHEQSLDCCYVCDIWIVLMYVMNHYILF